MYAQLTIFDGPRSPELVAAGDRAGRERIEPLLDAHPDLIQDLVARYVLTQPDGGQAVLVIAGHESSLDKAVELITTSELLPGEDPALLPGPSRVERYQVADVRHGGAR
ncbi:MAG TPA: hypothetical protein VIU11_17975 [Nakamurella sp.]